MALPPRHAPCEISEFDLARAREARRGPDRTAERRAKCAVPARVSVKSEFIIFFLNYKTKKRTMVHAHDSRHAHRTATGAAAARTRRTAPHGHGARGTRRSDARRRLPLPRLSHSRIYARPACRETELRRDSRGRVEGVRCPGSERVTRPASASGPCVSGPRLDANKTYSKHNSCTCLMSRVRNKLTSKIKPPLTIYSHYLWLQSHAASVHVGSLRPQRLGL